MIYIEKKKKENKQTQNETIRRTDKEKSKGRAKRKQKQIKLRGKQTKIGWSSQHRKQHASDITTYTTTRTATDNYSPSRLFEQCCASVVLFSFGRWVCIVIDLCFSSNFDTHLGTSSKTATIYRRYTNRSQYTQPYSETETKRSTLTHVNNSIRSRSGQTSTSVAVITESLNPLSETSFHSSHLSFGVCSFSSCSCCSLCVVCCVFCVCVVCFVFFSVSSWFPLLLYCFSHLISFPHVTNLDRFKFR